MQNSGYTVVPTKIPIPKHIEIGKLIGREGRNLKPIAERTGTSISVNTNTNPAQIEIKIRTHNNTSSSRPPSENQINEAKDQLSDLIKNLESERERRKRLIREDKEKEFECLKDFYRGREIMSIINSKKYLKLPAKIPICHRKILHVIRALQKANHYYDPHILGLEF